jgi:hypothetical protein
VTVAIDYDATWSSDPELWESFAIYAKGKGHKVILITNRSDNHRNRQEVGGAVGRFVDEMILAGPIPKREAAARYNIYPHIWIDDKPQTVTEGLKR